MNWQFGSQVLTGVGLSFSGTSKHIISLWIVNVVTKEVCSVKDTCPEGQSVTN